jgi:ribosomal protein S18 acetylase RimI-like enzyme
MQPSEYPILREFLYEAIYQPDDSEPLPRSILNDPALEMYIKDFGSLADDHCLCAEVSGSIVGAVWVRNIAGYGSIDEKTPECAISLFREFRGKGIGTALLIEMLNYLKEKGYEKVSLSVQKENYAVKMYQNAGFKTLSETEEELIMVADLKSDPAISSD